MDLVDPSDTFAICPYNPKHRVPRLRLQNHLVKCQVNYPDYAICPYNATHRVIASEIQNHSRDCPSKCKIFPENQPPKVIAAILKPKAGNQNFIPEMDPHHEIWDN